MKYWITEIMKHFRIIEIMEIIDVKIISVVFCESDHFK